MEIQRCCGGFFRVSGNVSWKDAAVTPKEIKLLAVLLENAGQVVSRDQILDRIWGEEESPFDRVVDVYVKICGKTAARLYYHGKGRRL